MITDGIDVEVRRSRLIRILGYFPTLVRAAEVLGLPEGTLARATSDERLDLQALRDVEAVLDRMDADFVRVGMVAPIGRPLAITLPDGHRVNGVVVQLVPQEGAPHAEIDVFGPNLFDSERSGRYVADLLRFEELSGFEPLGMPRQDDGITPGR